MIRPGVVAVGLVLLSTLAAAIAVQAADAVPTSLLVPGATNVVLAPSVPEAMPGVAFPVFRILLALGLVLGVLFGGVWVFRRLPQWAGNRGVAPRLRVLEVRVLGGKHALFVIGYDQQRLLVGSSPTGINLIDRLPPESELPGMDTAGSPAPPSFVAALAQILRTR
jgi:flagellar biogenesis protein FliO